MAMGPFRVEATVNVQPPACLSVHPMSLSHAEYETLMLQSPQSPPKMSPVEPASVSTEATAPAPVAASVTELVGGQPSSPLAGQRPGSLKFPTQSAVSVSASAASSSTAVMPAHTRPKPHQPRSLKRRAGSAVAERDSAEAASTEQPSAWLLRNAVAS